MRAFCTEALGALPPLGVFLVAGTFFLGLAMAGLAAGFAAGFAAGLAAALAAAGFAAGFLAAGLAAGFVTLELEAAAAGAAVAGFFSVFFSPFFSADLPVKQKCIDYLSRAKKKKKKMHFFFIVYLLNIFFTYSFTPKLLTFIFRWVERRYSTMNELCPKDNFFLTLKQKKNELKKNWIFSKVVTKKMNL